VNVAVSNKLEPSNISAACLCWQHTRTCKTIRH